jgi:hypothetical protein
MDEKLRPRIPSEVQIAWWRKGLRCQTPTSPTVGDKGLFPKVSKPFWAADLIVALAAGELIIVVTIAIALLWRAW